MRPARTGSSPVATRLARLGCATSAPSSCAPATCSASGPPAVVAGVRRPTPSTSAQYQIATARPAASHSGGSGRLRASPLRDPVRASTRPRPHRPRRRARLPSHRGARRPGRSRGRAGGEAAPRGPFQVFLLDSRASPRIARNEHSGCTSRMRSGCDRQCSTTSSIFGSRYQACFEIFFPVSSTAIRFASS